MWVYNHQLQRIIHFQVLRSAKTFDFSKQLLKSHLQRHETKFLIHCYNFQMSESESTYFPSVTILGKFDCGFFSLLCICTQNIEKDIYKGNQDINHIYSHIYMKQFVTQTKCHVP